jgi:hypothetical protein
LGLEEVEDRVLLSVLMTDKPAYAPEETVAVTGSGFLPNAHLDVPVIRPDGSIVKGDGTFAPGWDSVLADGSGDFACRIAKILNQHGVRKYGIIRIDSADSPSHWQADPQGNTKKIAATFRDAAKVAKDHGERLAAEGEICWAGMHSWKNMLDLLNEVGMRDTVGFQADQAHTYLYLLGYNAPEHALLKPGYTPAEFDAAFTKMTDALRPWTFDFHVAQNDGSVHGTGSHDNTGRHCPADDPNGKLDIVRTAGAWLKDAKSRRLHHICWDGCMFPNAMLETQDTWNKILAVMVKVREAHGWRE